MDDEERNLGMRWVAAPVFNKFGEAVGDVSISGPTVRVTDEQIAALRPARERGGARPDAGDWRALPRCIMIEGANL